MVNMDRYTMFHTLFSGTIVEVWKVTEEVVFHWTEGKTQAGYTSYRYKFIQVVLRTKKNIKICYITYVTRYWLR